MAHVGALLNEAQKNAASHPRLLKAMQRCIGADAAVVAAALRQGTDIVLLAEKQDPLVDRTLNFIAKACALHPSVLAPAFLEVSGRAAALPPIATVTALPHVKDPAVAP